MTKTKPKRKLTFQIEALVDYDDHPKGAYLWTIRHGKRGGLLFCGVRGTFEEAETAVRKTFEHIRPDFGGNAITDHE